MVMLSPGVDPRDGLEAALKAYEQTLRPFVAKAQQLPPGVPGYSLPQVPVDDYAHGLALWFLLTIKIDKLFSMFASDDVGGWDLPNYPELGTIEAK